MTPLARNRILDALSRRILHSRSPAEVESLASLRLAVAMAPITEEEWRRASCGVRELEP